MSNNFLIQNQDQTVESVCRLGAVVQRSAAGAVYETEFGDDALPAVVKIRPVESPDAGRLLLAQWQSVIGFAHPNLLRVYAAGSSVLDDVALVYIVMERADASLAGVLTERALSAEETEEMLVPTISALRYLHKNGYAHSGLKPSNILAVGDQVKLSSDSVRRIADEQEPADDIRALGAVIVQALTGKLRRWKKTLDPTF